MSYIIQCKTHGMFFYAVDYDYDDDSWFVPDRHYSFCVEPRHANQFTTKEEANTLLSEMLAYNYWHYDDFVVVEIR